MRSVGQLLAVGLLGLLGGSSVLAFDLVNSGAEGLSPQCADGKHRDTGNLWGVHAYPRTSSAGTILWVSCLRLKVLSL